MREDILDRPDRKGGDPKKGVYVLLSAILLEVIALIMNHFHIIFHSLLFMISASVPIGTYLKVILSYRKFRMVFWAHTAAFSVSIVFAYVLNLTLLGSAIFFGLIILVGVLSWNRIQSWFGFENKN
ncbi:hypothetical protein [Halocola ammonii]